MSINDFYQLFVGIFALLASVFILMSLVLSIWSAIRIRKFFILLIRTMKKIDHAADEVESFVARNIDYIELQKAKLENFGWLRTFLSFFIHNKEGRDAENN